jgi:glycerol-3-phosphate acyltransferase PlsY
VPYLYIIAAVVICYIIGSIPFGLVTGLAVGRIDIRTQGSGNIGATNVGRLLGKKWGVVVFVLDFFKGFLPVFSGTIVLNRLIGPETGLLNTAEVLMGLSAILGHVYPVFLRFKGGKGASTSAGVLTAIQWQVPAICFPVWAVLLFSTRIMSIASMTAAVCVPVLFIIIGGKEAFGKGLPGTLFGFAIAALVVYAHRSNIRRLLDGTENKLFGTAEEPDPAAEDTTETE